MSKVTSNGGFRVGDKVRMIDVDGGCMLWPDERRLRPGDTLTVKSIGEDGEIGSVEEELRVPDYTFHDSWFELVE